MQVDQTTIPVPALPIPVTDRLTLFDLFEATVERCGARVAVEVQRKDGLDRFTYRRLHALALDRAAWLASSGVGPGDRCAILAHNDADWCAAYLAILALGAVAVPLDTSYSAQQVATILRDAGVSVVFASDRLAGLVDHAIGGGAGIAVLDVHAHEDHAALAPKGVPSLDPGAVNSSQSRSRGSDVNGAPGAPGAAGPPSEQPAVILYTSGTTSDPKGVVLSHANLIAERDAAFAVIDVSARDSVLGVLPLFHALAQLANLLLPFAVGARVVFLETLSSQELVRALSERQITLFACVPQFFYLIHERVMREVAGRGALARRLFRALLALSFRARRLGLNAGPLLFAGVHRLMGRQVRLFVTGGSKFDPAIGRDLYSLGFTILQAYGLTETSGAATISAPREAHIDTVGRPLPGVEVSVLPPEPERSDGEIAVRGPIVMQGYYNREDATAAAMRDGWLLTGDLGRFDAAGRLTITGRKKEVIILANGKNLYPEDVEAHYRQSPYVKEICVTTLAGRDGAVGERLYAVVVPNVDLLRERRMANAGEILRFEIEGLSASLPSFKRVHGYEIRFDPLPRTTTGKIKRHEIDRRVREASRREAAAGTEADQAWLNDPHVAAAVAVARDRAAAGSRLSPDANLELDLGLDSMERVELVTDLEQRFGVRVPEDRAHLILTLGELVDAVRPSARAAPPDASRAAAPADESWAVLLRDLPSPADPVLGSLLRRRRVLAPLLYAVGGIVSNAVARVEAKGRDHLPRDGAFILSPNHQSYLDAFFICGAMPYSVFERLFFIGAVEYFETPFMSWLARKLNCVPVDPDSNLVPAMKAGAFGLSHGRVLMLFPEGERSIDGTVRRFKKGAPILSRHLRVPVVPVAIKGAYELWPRGRGFNWRTLLPWNRGRVRLEFGEPIQFGNGEAHAEAASRLRVAVDEMWQRL
jgi:long-chain acyl-CoA synthetase